jgi:hypothetical protein
MRWPRGRAVNVLAFAGVALLLAVGPAAAHEGTGTTVPAGAAPPGMATMTQAPPSTGTSAEAGGMTTGPGPTSEFRTAYFLAVLAVTAAGALALRAALPLLRPGASARPADSVAAAALVVAGVAHCAVTPSHWAEGWHLGLFFAVSGLLLLGQGAAVWLRPSAVAYASVVASTVGFIVLYFLVREFSLPFVGHRDPYLFQEYPVKVAEGLAALVAVAALVRTRWARLPDRLAAV